MNQSLFIVFISFISYSNGLSAPFVPCGGRVTEVRAFGCANDTLPCIIQRPTKGRVEVDFISPFDARSLWADVKGKTGTARIPIYVPLPGFDKDACNGHGIDCPVKKGEQLTYTYDMVVDGHFPSVNTDAQWKLTDYWGFTVACFKVDMVII